MLSTVADSKARVLTSHTYLLSYWRAEYLQLRCDGPDSASHKTARPSSAGSPSVQLQTRASTSLTLDRCPAEELLVTHRSYKNTAVLGTPVNNDSFDVGKW